MLLNNLNKVHRAFNTCIHRVTRSHKPSTCLHVFVRASGILLCEAFSFVRTRRRRRSDIRIGPAFCFPRDFPLRRCWGWYAIEVHWPRQCWGLVLTSMATWLSFWCRASFLRRRDHNDICSKWWVIGQHPKKYIARRRGAYVAKNTTAPEYTKNTVMLTWRQ